MLHCSGQNNTTLFVHGLKLWYHVLPPRKLHSSGNLATGTMNFTSRAIFLLFYVFPSCTFLLRFVLWVAGSDAGWEAGPRGLGWERSCAAFPSLQDCCWHSLQCRSQPSGRGLAGRGFCYTLFLAGMLSFRTVPLAVLTNPYFPVSKQHQPRLRLSPLQHCREEKGSSDYLILLCPLQMLWH